MLIRTFWGLLYLILFGVCLFLGTRKRLTLARGILFSMFLLTQIVWVVIVVLTEINLFVLYLFSLPEFPLFDLYQVLVSNYPFRYMGFKNYFVLKTEDLGPELKGSKSLIIVLYGILFCTALQVSVFRSELAKNPKPKRTATVLLAEAHKKSKTLHVPLPPPKGRKDFTLEKKSR